MELVDQTSDSNEPEQPAVETYPFQINDSSNEKDEEKPYSTRKRRSAPRRYSPTPSWERWEIWENCSAASGEKSESANISEALNHINGNKEKISLPRNSSLTMSSYDGVETKNSNTTVLSKKKIKKRSFSLAPSDFEKTMNKVLSPATADRRRRSPVTKIGNERRDSPAATRDRSPTPAATNLKKSKNRSPSLLATDPEKSKCKTPAPAATVPEKFECRPLTPAAADPKASKYRPPTAAQEKTKCRPPTTAAGKTECTSRTPAATRSKKSVRGKTRQNKKSELKESPKAGLKRRRSPKKPLEVKEKKVYGTRAKRSAPKRYSPTHLSDQKVMLFAGEVHIASGNRSRTPTADISESISIKWANVLNRNPYVLLERYRFVPPSSPLPLDNTNDFGSEGEFRSEGGLRSEGAFGTEGESGSEGSGSRVCTPTPSWMDEEEMASYYNSEFYLDIGKRSLSSSSGNGSLTPDKDVLDYDRSTCSPVLNDVAITTSLDQVKSSPILSLNNTATDSGTALGSEFDTCSPIPPLDVSSILTSLEHKFDLGECTTNSSWGTTDVSCTSKRASTSVLSDTPPTIIRQDIISVGKKTCLVSTVDEASAVTTEDKSDQVGAAAVCTNEENRSSPVPSLDGTCLSTIGNNTLSSGSSVDEAALVRTEGGRCDQVGATSVSTTEEGGYDRVSPPDVAFDSISVSNGSCCVDSLNWSGMLKCVASVDATTEEIVLSSDDTVLSKTDTYKPVTSKCVQTKEMVDASVDTSELFPFPPLNSGTSTVNKTEINGPITRECISSLPLSDTAVDTSELDTKVPMCNLPSGDSNPIRVEEETPVTRRQRLNPERISCASSSKPSVFNSSDSVRYNSNVNISTYVQRGYCTNVTQKPIKKEAGESRKESLILIRRDYKGPQPLSSPLCFSSVDSDDHRSWEDDSRAERHSSPTRTNEENVTMNPDLTEDDVFDILFGQKTRRDIPFRKNASQSPKSGHSRKRRNSDVEPRCLSPSYDSSTATAGDDAFEMVCAKRRYSPSAFRLDSRNRNPILVNAVSPRPRKRSHSPAVSLPEDSSPFAASSTRTLKRCSLSNNVDGKPRKSASCLSLSVCEGKAGYVIRKKRSAPKRYNHTSSCLDETINSSAENSFRFEREKKPYATRSSRSAPKRYSPTSFYDAYYYYEHKDQYTTKSLSDTGNKVDDASNRKVRRMSVKSTSRESLKVDDDSHWGKFHGASCTKQCASLTIIKDTPVPRDIDDKFRAQKTAPPEVSVADSKIPDAGNGAWASEAIPAGTRFGPYEGRVVPAKVFTSYAWLIRKNGKPDRCVDATEPGLSNWMRFVNCARHDGEQNLEAFQCHGNIYYKTTRQVNPHEELLVWYGDEYGRQLGIDPKVCDEEDEKSWREKNFKCPACPFAFASPLYLQNHKRVCRDLKSGAGSSTESKKETSKSHKKPSPAKIRKSNSQSDLVIKDGPCVKSFPGPMQLGPSSRTWKKCQEQSTKDGYFCKSCHIGFLRKCHWERHLMTKKHGAKEPAYTCSQCNKTFHVKSSLTRHMNVHTGDMPYACPKCNRRFSDKGNMKKHMENHIGKKYFACAECNMKFTEKGSLTKHYYSKHTKTDKKLACGVCKKRYCDKQSLRRHQMIHNGEKPFACYVCNKRFSRRELLKNHLKVHSI